MNGIGDPNGSTTRYLLGSMGRGTVNYVLQRRMGTTQVFADMMTVIYVMFCNASITSDILLGSDSWFPPVGTIRILLYNNRTATSASKLFLKGNNDMEIWDKRRLCVFIWNSSFILFYYYYYLLVCIIHYAILRSFFESFIMQLCFHV